MPTFRAALKTGPATPINITPVMTMRLISTAYLRRTKVERIGVSFVAGG
jgi:hypothetical protein